MSARLDSPQALEISWLYEAIDRARRARLAMDRMTSWGPDYHEEFVRRRDALALAHEHRNRLEAERVEIPEDLLAALAHEARMP